jgi:acylphosphatase
MARVTSSVQINESGSKFGLPNQISLPPRRLAMLVGDGSVEATTQGEMHTVERVKQSIALPGQHALDGLLAINDSLKGLLRTLGLETVETTWSKREVKLLEREAFNRVQNDE